MTSCHSVTTPFNPNVKLDKTPNNTEPILSQLVYEHSAVVGLLNFAAIATKLDLKYAVYELSQFMSNLSSTYWTTVKCTLNLGITYLPSNLNSYSYSDVNWETNLTDQRSVLGYTIMFGGGAIFQYSKKQSTVVLSTIKAKYMVLSNTTHKCLWIQKLLTKLGIPPSNSATINIDNQTTIKFTENL